MKKLFKHCVLLGICCLVVTSAVSAKTVKSASYSKKAPPTTTAVTQHDAVAVVTPPPVPVPTMTLCNYLDGAPTLQPLASASYLAALSKTSVTSKQLNNITVCGSQMISPEITHLDDPAANITTT